VRGAHQQTAASEAHRLPGSMLVRCAQHILRRYPVLMCMLVNQAFNGTVGEA
jgi:hypothetical protein